MRRIGQCLVALSGQNRLFFIVLALAALTVPGGEIRAQESGVTNDTVKIGIFAPFSGSVASWGHPIVVGARVVYDEVNDKGGIHGRKIVVVEEDDQCDPTKGVAAVKKLIEDHRVFLLQTAGCSNVALAGKPLILQAKVPLLASGPTASAIFTPTTPYIFTTSMTSDLQGELLANFAASVPNLKRVAVISHRDTWGLASLEPALNRLRTQYKMEPVATEALDRGANDSTPQTLRLKAANPDVVIMILYEKEGAVFLRDTVKYGLDSVIVGPTAMQDLGKIVELAGTNAVARKLYILRDTPYAMNEPPMAGVVERIKARYPSVSFVNSSAAIIYSSASVIVEGLRRAGRDLTRDKFLKELESLQGFADGGLLPGTVTFSPTEHRGRKSGVFGVYKEGKVVSIGDKYVPLP